MGFVFRYETLLKLRRNQEDEKQRDLSESLALQGQEEQKLSHLYDQYEAALTQKQELSAQSGPLVGSIQSLNSFIEGQRLRIDRQRARLNEVISEVEEKRDRIKEAMTERKTIEKLKENDYQKWKSELAKREEKQIDEMNTMRASWRHRQK